MKLPAIRRAGVLRMQWFLGLQAWEEALLVSLMLYTATALGASLVFFSKKYGGVALTLLTGFSAGIMIAASFFSLLLPALEYSSVLPPYLTVTIGFLLGGGLLIAADVLLSARGKGVRGMDAKNGLMYLAVTLHNIPEGMSVGVAVAAAAGAQGAMIAALLFAVGIAVQNFPEGACVAFPLRGGGMSPLKSFLLSQGSGAVEIPACVLGAVAATFISGLLPWALAFSAGAMIAVVCSELIPECFAGNKTIASLGILFGFCLMMILDVALG